jgi:hypothetical protein
VVAHRDAEFDTADAIRIRLTQDEASFDEVQEALDSLIVGGYAEEFEADRYKIGRGALAATRSLLGERVPA